jgi:hypothetical protein
VEDYVLPIVPAIETTLTQQEDAGLHKLASLLFDGIASFLLWWCGNAAKKEALTGRCIAML